MKSKRLLNFYFKAESLNRTLDNLITKYALASVDFTRGCEYYAQKICSLIYAKRKLGELWRYLDGVICKFTDEEKRVLRFYGGLRGGTSRLSADKKRVIKRVAVKFARRARNIQSYAEGTAIAGEYYSLLSAGDYCGGITVLTERFPVM